MSKRVTILATAIGILAALSLPSSASAAWKHHATEIQANATIGLTGNIRKQGGLGGIECQVTTRVQFLAHQTTGLVETFVPHPVDPTTNCKGLGGLAFCQIHNVLPTNLPWLFHTGTNDISLTIGEIHYQTTGGFCPVKQVTTTAGTLTLTPNQPNTFSTFSVSGNTQIHLETNSGASDTETVSASGTLTVEPPYKNTYSV
ncbi:MAG TPA: hypothetical protein VFY48_05955 [Solirubrobacterales bacterium]|nr:hypothetical protein [Solirubrobacterales bacterium]